MSKLIFTTVLFWASLSTANSCKDIANEVKSQYGGTNLRIASQWQSGNQYFRYAFDVKDRGTKYICSVVVVNRKSYSGPRSACTLIQDAVCFDPNAKHDRPSWW